MSCYDLNRGYTHTIPLSTTQLQLSSPTPPTSQAKENRLIQLPPSIGSLCALTFLGLAANRLTSLPASLGDLISLRSLALASNRLTLLPPRLGSLTKLEVLLLDDNCLTDVPSTLASLPALVELGLAANRLTTLPPLAALPSLRLLRLQSNALSYVPLEFRQLPLAEPLAWHDNPAYAPGGGSHDHGGGGGGDGGGGSGGGGGGGDGSGGVSRGYDSFLLAAATRAADARQRGGEVPPSTRTPKPRVALLLPGLVRNYAHGGHWVRFVASYSELYDISVFMCLWEVRAPSRATRQWWPLRLS